MEVAIIGGGAAGFFLAVQLKQAQPATRVVIFERSDRVLTKVGLSGGGRCNVTNTFSGISDIAKVYPRGHRLMKRLLREFSPADAFQWFEDHGAKLMIQPDGCVFPESQDSQTIVDCLQGEALRLKVEIKLGHRITQIQRVQQKLVLSFAESCHTPQTFDCVALTTGGAPHAEGFDWLGALGHTMETPCPSLFTFNISHPELTQLMGISVDHASLTIPATKFRSLGSLLITHWGISGPATLKLSSYAARFLSEKNFRAPLLINWLGEAKPEDVAEQLQRISSESTRKQLSNIHPESMGQRLWLYLLNRCGLKADKPWGELGNKSMNRLVNTLTADRYDINGKGAFREEFVTCGGVSLESIEARTLQSRHCPNLFFAGELLDVDGVTGGFNFQAAWTTAYVAAKAIAAYSPE